METPIRMHTPVGRKEEKRVGKRTEISIAAGRLKYCCILHMREGLLPIRLIYGGFLLQT